ncbi:hypothetical protein NSK_001223 [Nannochloropsis salina CCMP1776]|uniref:Uncharacterized protein n=1 Tax=Nannochloropsis salina CCMP1776 TaxID=1027361 RepID=A0A4D9D988_9STRA|nr:hypothetical protein NSK_001223 [Nannochloropsis salina CCMP1776]|eukprot:TFJ87876.1 hypothetical protein NSK_001223 [Nannochloropsis salina CCMP1776]
MKVLALLAVFLAAVASVSAFLTVPSHRCALSTQGSTANICKHFGTTSARSARNAMLLMKVMPGGNKGENERLRTLESDSERWFQEQERREANGEIGLLENPAFYTAIFFLCPLVILVASAATGVIPGFISTPSTYSTLDEVKSSLSYGELTSAAEYASGASSLF